MHAVLPDQILDQFNLVILAFAQEPLERLARGHLLPHERLVGVDVLAHPPLDLLEVSLADRHPVWKVEVVVETIIDRGPDRDLDPGVQLQHRGGEHVRRVVANQRQRLITTAVREDLDRRCGAIGLRQGARQVAHFSIDLHRQRGPCQSGADCGGGLRTARTFGKQERVAVGELVFHRPMDPTTRLASMVAGAGRPDLKLEPDNGDQQHHECPTRHARPAHWLLDLLDPAAERPRAPATAGPGRAGAAIVTRARAAELGNAISTSATQPPRAAGPEPTAEGALGAAATAITAHAAIILPSRRQVGPRCPHPATLQLPLPDD